jgi:hypothetical protein
VASIEEIASALQAASDRVGEAIGETNAAEAKTDDLIGVMSSSGIDDKVAELNAVKEAIEELRAHLQGGVDLADKVINQVRAAGG